MLPVGSSGGLLVYSAGPAAACSALTGEDPCPDDDTPVLDTLADITAAAVEHNSLPPRELMIARLAALIAVDAPPASYLANAGAAADSGVIADDIQAVMIAVAPVVGTARVVSAGGKILRALGFAVAVAVDEMADDEPSSSSNHARQ